MKVVNCKHETHTVYIGRGSIYGNPFTHLTLAFTIACYQCVSREESIEFYDLWLDDDPRFIHIEPRRRRLILESIERGDIKDDDILGCYCHPLPCHGDILIRRIQERKKRFQ